MSYVPSSPRRPSLRAVVGTFICAAVAAAAHGGSTPGDTHWGMTGALAAGGPAVVTAKPADTHW